MLRLSYRLYLLATGLHARIPRRLTKSGLLMASTMVLVGAIGSDIDQSMAFQAFALLLCLLLVAWIWVPFFRGRFAAERGLPRLATVEQPFRYRIHVRNLSGRPWRGLEILEDFADARPSFDEFARAMRPVGRMRAFRLAAPSRPQLEPRAAVSTPATLPALLPHREVDAQVEVIPLRRGPLRLTGVTVARCDPLGLVRSFIRVRIPQTVLVLPKRYRIPALANPGTQHYQPGGVAMASAIGESEEFVALRDYRPGDALRRIHWRSWARAGRPIVKEFQDENIVRQGLVLDTFAKGTEALNAFEEAVSVAASFACTLETQESLLDLLFVESRAFCFTTGRGLGYSQQVLEVLASVQPNQTGAFEMLSTLVLQHANVLAACTCVFVDWDKARQDLVRQLTAAGLFVRPLLVVNEARERKLSQQFPDLAREVCILTPGQIEKGLLSLERRGP